MSPERFNQLAELIRDKITRKHHVREPISPEERLAMTLHYLTTVNSQHPLGFMFKLGRSTVNGITNEVCEELWNALSDYVKPPTSVDDWKKNSADFNELWNITHCLEALDGKHVGIRKSPSSGSLWYNYKGFFSMVLLEICDARYCFSYVDVGEYGSNNDSEVLKNSRMG